MRFGRIWVEDTCWEEHSCEYVVLPNRNNKHVFSSHSAVFRPLIVISDDLGVIFDVFVKLSQKAKHYGRNEIEHGRTCGTEFTLVSLYSTEITRNRSWFLEYNLTQVNSVPHAGAHDGFSITQTLHHRYNCRKSPVYTATTDDNNKQAGNVQSSNSRLWSPPSKTEWLSRSEMCLW